MLGKLFSVFHFHRHLRIASDTKLENTARIWLNNRYCFMSQNQFNFINGFTAYMTVAVCKIARKLKISTMKHLTWLNQHNPHMKAYKHGCNATSNFVINLNNRCCLIFVYLCCIYHQRFYIISSNLRNEFITWKTLWSSCYMIIVFSQ